MKNLIFCFVAFLLGFFYAPDIFASSLFVPEDLSFIEKVIAWLESIDLDEIHATLSTIIALLLILLRLFKKKLKKALN